MLKITVENAEKNCFIHTVLLVTICFLLLVTISISCYYCYTKDWIKKEYTLPYLM